MNAGRHRAHIALTLCISDSERHALAMQRLTGTWVAKVPVPTPHPARISASRPRTAAAVTGSSIAQPPPESQWRDAAILASALTVAAARSAGMPTSLNCPEQPAQPASTCNCFRLSCVCEVVTAAADEGTERGEQAEASTSAPQADSKPRRPRLKVWPAANAGRLITCHSRRVHQQPLVRPTSSVCHLG